MKSYVSLLLLIRLGHTVHADNDFDLLIFTQNWPPTVCQHYKDENIAHQCAKLKSTDSWTVHGLWPTKLHTIGPGFCDPSMPFDVKKISPFMDKLETSWPSILGDKGEYSLWEHEWIKHGTCAAQLPDFNSEEKYFKKGLELFYQFNMTNILSKNGIEPSENAQYPVHAFQEAVLKTLSVNPHMECIFHKHTKKPHLLEIRICFDKTLKLVDCDGTLLGDGNPILGNCPVDSDIMYSTVMPAPAKPTQPTIQLRPDIPTGKLLHYIIETLVFLDWVI